MTSFLNVELWHFISMYAFCLFHTVVFLLSHDYFLENKNQYTRTIFMVKPNPEKLFIFRWNLLREFTGRVAYWISSNISDLNFIGHFVLLSFGNLIKGVNVVPTLHSTISFICLFPKTTYSRVTQNQVNIHNIIATLLYKRKCV